MPGSNDIRAGSAYVELGLKGDFGKQLDAAAARLKSFGESISRIGASIGAIGASILTPLLAAATAYGALGKELEIASQKTGIAVESLSELKYAAEQSGGSFEDLTNGIAKMQRSLNQAANESGNAEKAIKSLHDATKDFASGKDINVSDKARVDPKVFGANDSESESSGGGKKGPGQALRELNLSIADLRGLKPEEQLSLIADRFSGVTSASQRTAIAMAIFGRGGVSLVPMLQNLAALRERSRELGIVVSTDDARAATTFANTLRDVYDQAKAVTFQVGSAVAQALQPFANALRSVLPSVIEFTRENKGIIQTALAVGGGLVAVGGSMLLFGQSLKLVGSSWLAVSKLFTAGVAVFSSSIGLAGTLVGALLSPIALVGVAIVGLGAYFVIAGGHSKQFATAMRAGVDAVRNGFQSVLNWLDTALGSWQGFTGSIMSLWHAATYEVQSAWISVHEGIVKSWNYLKATFPGIIYGMGAPIADFASNTLDVMERLGLAIKNIWEGVVDAVSDAIAESMTKADVAASVMKKYDGKTLTKGDAEQLAAPAIQRSNNQFTQQAERDAKAKGLTGNAYSDAVTDQATPQQADANKKIIDDYTQRYAGKKLNDSQLQGLIDQQTQESLAYMTDMRKKDRDAREQSQNEELSGVVRASKDRIAKIQQWSKQGIEDQANKSTLDKMRDQQKASDAASAEQTELDKKRKQQIEDDKKSLDGAPKISQLLKDVEAKFSGDTIPDSTDKPDEIPNSNGPGTRSLLNIAGLQSLQGGGTDERTTLARAAAAQQGRIVNATEETAKNTRPKPKEVYGPPSPPATPPTPRPPVPPETPADAARRERELNKTHAAYLDDLRRQQSNAAAAGERTGYAAAGRGELGKTKRNDDGTYTVKSPTTGIFATLTKDQIDAIRKSDAVNTPRFSADALQQQALEAVRQRNAIINAQPKRPERSRGEIDVNGQRIAKAAEENNRLLRKLLGKMPNQALA